MNIDLEYARKHFENLIDLLIDKNEEEIEILPKENLISDDIINDAQQDLIPNDTLEAEDVFNDIPEDTFMGFPDMIEKYRNEGKKVADWGRT